MQPLNTVVTDNVEIIGGEMDPNLFEEDSSKVPQSCQQKRVTLQQIARQQLLGHSMPNQQKKILTPFNFHEIWYKHGPH